MGHAGGTDAMPRALAGSGKLPRGLVFILLLAGSPLFPALGAEEATASPPTQASQATETARQVYRKAAETASETKGLITKWWTERLNDEQRLWGLSAGVFLAFFAILGLCCFLGVPLASRNVLSGLFCLGLLAVLWRPVAYYYARDWRQGNC